MRPVTLAASCAAVLLVLGARARAAEPEPDDAEKSQPTKADKVTSEATKSQPDAPVYPPPLARWGIIGAGLATSAVSYGAAAGMSYAFPDAPGAKDLRTPIIGPWMAIAHNGCAADEPDCSSVWIAMRTIATAIGGLAQAGGILVAIEGIFMPTQYASEGPVRRAPSAPAEPPPAQEPPKSNDKNLFWIPTPMAMGTGGVGLGVVGRF
jgi:hypothetical protein